MEAEEAVDAEDSVEAEEVVDAVVSVEAEEVVSALIRPPLQTRRQVRLR